MSKWLVIIVIAMIAFIVFLGLAANHRSQNVTNPSSEPSPSAVPSLSPSGSQGGSAGVQAAALLPRKGGSGNKATPKPSRTPASTPKPDRPAKPIARRKTVSVVRKPVGGITLQRVTRTVGAARDYARSALGPTQFACLNNIIIKESNWNPFDLNTSSGAYGLPQALPGSKMASAGSDWRTNPVTQIKWMINTYIKNRYGSPCAAWQIWQSRGWY